MIFFRTLIHSFYWTLLSDTFLICFFFFSSNALCTCNWVSVSAMADLSLVDPYACVLTVAIGVMYVNGIGGPLYIFLSIFLPERNLERGCSMLSPASYRNDSPLMLRHSCHRSALFVEALVWYIRAVKFVIRYSLTLFTTDGDETNVQSWGPTTYNSHTCRHPRALVLIWVWNFSLLFDAHSDTTTVPEYT